MTMDLTGLILTHGAHPKATPDCCVMEAAAILSCAVRDSAPATDWADALARFSARLQPWVAEHTGPRDPELEGLAWPSGAPAPWVRRVNQPRASR